RPPRCTAFPYTTLFRSQGIAEAEVRSAVELTAAQKSALAQMLARVTGKRVETTYALDPALLGGAVVRIGDTVYDGSLRHRLDERSEEHTSELQSLTNLV